MAKEGDRFLRWLTLIFEQRQLSDAMQVLNGQTHGVGWTAGALLVLHIFRDRLNTAVVALQDVGNDEHQIFEDLWHLAIQAHYQTQRLLYGLRRLAIQGLQEILHDLGTTSAQLERNAAACAHAAAGGNYDNGVMECSICLQEFGDGEQVIVMPCPSSSHGHKFHPGCIARWLVIRQTCPLCRHQLSERSTAANAYDQ